MSESLPGTAPLGEAAVPSVEASAPASFEEVATDSAPGTDDKKYVEADRFNGLMGRFNRTQNELSAAQQRIAELEAAATSAPAQEESAQMTDVSALQDQISALQELLLKSEVDKARTAAIEKYPEAAPLADLIIADSPQAAEDMARLIAERLRKTQPEAPASQAGEEPSAPTPQVEAEQPLAAPAAPPAAPVVAGGTVAAGIAGPTSQERVVDAIKSRDFGSFLEAAWQRQQESNELVL